MAEMMICKSCGFITEKGKLGDRCPACGVPAKMFLPHDERISPRRKLLLSLDIHPVMVHFPQAFTATVLLLSIAGLIVRGPSVTFLGATVRTLGTLLPLTVALSFVSGIIDGKIRFRKVKTPLLMKKMALGSMYFLFALGVAASALTSPVSQAPHFAVVALFALPAFACSAVLGILGTSLLNARFPG
jgi:hypothetical protein